MRCGIDTLRNRKIINVCIRHFVVQQRKQALQILCKTLYRIAVGGQIVCAEVDDKIFRLHIVENAARQEVLPVVSRRGSDTEFERVIFVCIRRIEVAPVPLGIVEEGIAEEYRSRAVSPVGRIPRLDIVCLVGVVLGIPLTRSGSVYARTNYIETCRVAAARYLYFKRSLGERFYGFRFLSIVSLEVSYSSV